MKKWLAIAFTSVALGSCANGADLGFAGDEEYKMYHSETSKVRKMAEDPYTLRMAAFADLRSPAETIKQKSDGVIYEYDATKLLQSVDVYVPSVMARHLKFGEQKDVIYNVDVELTKLRTFIETGSIFRGSFGGYVVDVAANVRIRDDQSRILIEHPIKVRTTDSRRAVQGYHPSAAQDEQKMRELVAESLKELAIRTGWMAHISFEEAEEQARKAAQ